MRLGLYGGSFDPVHYGHLLLAECCRETLALDEVWLIPAAIPPHKQTQDRAAAKHRLQMIELALAGHEQIRGSSIETDRGGVSYTVETLAQIQNRVLGVGVNSSSLFTEVPAYFTFGVRGGIRLGPHQVLVDFKNLNDENYRGISWGLDAPGRSIALRYQLRF